MAKLLTFAGMTINSTPAPTLDPRHVFLDIAGLMDRYSLRRTATYELVKRPGFPAQVAPRRWRLDQVLAYEDQAGRSHAPTSPFSKSQRTAHDLSSADSSTDARTRTNVLSPRRSTRKLA